MRVCDLARWNQDTDRAEQEIEELVAHIEGRPVRIDFKADASPFKKAERVEKRIKLFLWGASGSGKTTLALSFPGAAVIDLERGTEHYGDSFAYEVLPATTPDEVSGAVDWLATHEHEYRTLVIDPITVYWEALQKKWSDIYLHRNQTSKGFRFEFYDLQPKDWNTIKAELRELIRKLLALDMNVIVTARAKVLYEGEGKDFMKAAGETFDGEKSLPYLFDSILRLDLGSDGKHWATTVKDRTGHLPQGRWEASFDQFQRAFPHWTLERKAKRILPASQAQKDRIAALKADLKLPEEKFLERLQSYGAEGLDDLTKQAAEEILVKLEEAASRRSAKQEPPAAAPPAVASA